MQLNLFKIISTISKNKHYLKGVNKVQWNFTQILDWKGNIRSLGAQT